MMRFGVLGPVAAWSDGRPIALGGLRQRGLLALLLDWSPAQVAADRLVDQLWNGSPPPTASSALRVHLAKLRAALRAGGGDVLTGTAGYHVDLTTHALDADEFERMLTKAAGSSGTTTIEALDAALALWRGDPFADLDSVVALAPAAERLRELRAGALERHAELLVSLGCLEAAVAELQDLVRANPLRERYTELLMSALYQQGRQADALRGYRYLRTTLVEELGIEPGPSARQLEHAILLQDPRLDTSAVGTLPVPAPPAIWPAALDVIARRPFVGRVAELTRLARSPRGDRRGCACGGDHRTGGNRQDEPGGAVRRPAQRRRDPRRVRMERSVRPSVRVVPSRRWRPARRRRWRASGDRCEG